MPVPSPSLDKHDVNLSAWKRFRKFRLPCFCFPTPYLVQHMLFLFMLGPHVKEGEVIKQCQCLIGGGQEQGHILVWRRQCSRSSQHF